MFRRLFAFLILLGLSTTACTATEGEASAPGLSQSQESAKGFYLATKILRSADKLPGAPAFQLASVEGVAIRIPWSVIQPSADRNDWTLLDAVVKQAVANRKKISIGVVAGNDAPDWLATKGVPFDDFVVARPSCTTIKAPIFWSEAYVNAYVAMMRAVKDHLVAVGAYDLVTIVKMTPIVRDSFELRMPIDSNKCSLETDNKWGKIGYRPAKVVAAWGKIAEGVAQIYPGKILAQAIIQKDGFPTIDDSGRKVPIRQVNAGKRIIALCIQQYKSLCGVQWNALKVTGPLAQRALDARQQGATLGWQTNLYAGPAVGAGCAVDRRAADIACTDQTYTATLKRGIDLGATFIEVWEPDMARYPNAFVAAGKSWPK